MEKDQDERIEKGEEGELEGIKIGVKEMFEKKGVKKKE